MKYKNKYINKKYGQIAGNSYQCVNRSGLREESCKEIPEDFYFKSLEECQKMCNNEIEYNGKKYNIVLPIPHHISSELGFHGKYHDKFKEFIDTKKYIYVADNFQKSRFIAELNKLLNLNQYYIPGFFYINYLSLADIIKNKTIIETMYNKEEIDEQHKKLIDLNRMKIDLVSTMDSTFDTNLLKQILEKYENLIKLIKVYRENILNFNVVQELIKNKIDIKKIEKDIINYKKAKSIYEFYYKRYENNFNIQIRKGLKRLQKDLISKEEKITNVLPIYRFYDIDEVSNLEITERLNESMNYNQSYVCLNVVIRDIQEQKSQEPQKAHANLLIINKTTNPMELFYFEPHIEMQGNLKNVITEYFRNYIAKNVIVHTINDFYCPANKNKTNLSLQGDDEFCQTWVIFAMFLHLKNPNVPYEILYNIFIEKIKPRNYLIKFLFYIYLLSSSLPKNLQVSTPRNYSLGTIKLTEFDYQDI